MMGQYDHGPRYLPYPLRHPLVKTRTVEDDGDFPPSSFVWPDDPDERVIVPFYLSLNEYNVLGSTIDVGSDPAFGIDALRVVWLWLRNMRIEVPMCAAIASAIMTCGDVRAALQAWFIDALYYDLTFQYQVASWLMTSPIALDSLSEVVAQAGIPAQIADANIIAQGPCDADVLYAQAVAIVDTLHSLSGQFLTAVGAGVDPIAYAQAVLTVMPFVGGFFQSVFVVQFATQLATALYPVYGAAWTALDKQDLYCDLYCLIDRNCSITLEQIIDFYDNRAGFGFDESAFEGFRSAVDTIANGGLSGDQVVYAMHLLMLTAMRMGGTIAGIDFGQYSLAIVGAASAPNPDVALCDPCADPSCLDEENFHIGTVVEQNGLEYLVEGSPNVIQWGQMDLLGPVCTLESIQIIEGVLSSGYMLDENLNSRSFDDLPLAIRYVDFSSGNFVLTAYVTFS